MNFEKTKTEKNAVDTIVVVSSVILVGIGTSFGVALGSAGIAVGTLTGLALYGVRRICK